MWRNLRESRFSVVGLLVFTGLAAALIALWLPEIRRQLQIVSFDRSVEATSSLGEAVARGDSAGLAREIAAGGSPNARANVKWENYQGAATALNVAIYNRDDASVRMLLDSGADPSFGLPTAPLQFVLESDRASSDKMRVVDVLLEAGAEPRFSAQFVERFVEEDHPDKLRLIKRLKIEYGLREMCIAGDLESLKEHLSGPVGEVPTNFTFTWAYRGTWSLLGIALVRADAEMAQWLLDAGATTAVVEAHGASAIHLAAVGNCIEMLEPLVRAGCDINAVDVTGDTPLDYADGQSDPATVAALIKLGAKRSPP